MGNIGVGLELSFSRLKLVVLEHRKEGAMITHFDIENVLKGQTQEENVQNLNIAINAILKRNKIRGKLAVSFPAHAIFSRQIKMLPQPDAELHNTISFEINEYLPFPANEAIWGYHKIERAYNPGEEYDVVVVAAKYEVMEQMEQILGDLIYKIDILQFAPVAIYSYLRYEFADKKETYLVLDIGETNNDMIMVEEGKFWHRSLGLSGKDVTKAIVSKLNVSEEEAHEMKKGDITSEVNAAVSPFIKNLATEVNRSINFYKYTSKKAVVSEIKLCGSTVKLKNLPKMLQDTILIKTTVMDMPQNIFINPSIEQVISEDIYSLYPAIGLALQAANLTTISLNFSPEYVVEYRKFSKKKPLALVGLFLLIIAVVLAFFSFSKKTAILQTDVGKMAKIVSSFKKLNEDYDNVKTQMNRAYFINYLIKNVYKSNDKILYLLDAIGSEIKKYNVGKLPEEKIYLVGFDYTIDPQVPQVKAELSKGQPSGAKGTEDKSRNVQPEKRVEDSIEVQYTKRKVQYYKILIYLATQRDFGDYSTEPLRIISREESVLDKLLDRSKLKLEARKPNEQPIVREGFECKRRRCYDASYECMKKDCLDEARCKYNIYECKNTFDIGGATKITVSEDTLNEVFNISGSAETPE